MTRAAVVVCPGRGSYSASELGYLSRPAPGPVKARLDAAIERADDLRAARGEMTIREIDRARKFKKSFFAGNNAAGITFACTAFDVLRLDPSSVDVVAAVGNSMGWYSALFAGGALSLDEAFELVETMGSSTAEHGQGGQVVFPVVDDDWRVDEARAAAIDTALTAAREAGSRAGISIVYGGFAILWADDRGLKMLLKRLPPAKLGSTKYPFQLPGHAAFHSPLMREACELGVARLEGLSWNAPAVPLIDGRGVAWRPLTADPAALAAYTLKHQVLDTFDFAAAVRVALREYAPDVFVLLGPGDTLGAAVAQVLIAEHWDGIRNREAFVARQAEDPLLLSLAREEQARAVTLASG